MKKFYLIFVFVLMVFSSNAQQQPFITTWEVGPTDLSITIPTQGTGYNYVVDFGDGTILNNVTGNATHTYNTQGIYTVTISGSFPRIYLAADSYGARELVSVEQWGDIQWTSMEGAFKYCGNLVINAPDIPDLSQVTNMSNMFAYAFHFNNSINNWDVSNVTNMSEMFLSAEDFNQPLNNWDVSNVTNMSGMFDWATDFNQSINNWDVSSVTDMEAMFHAAITFDQPLNNWDVSNVTNMKFMFGSAHSFNQPINNWDVSNVTDMMVMFHHAILFNQPLNNWDVSNVVTMESMFNGADSFNQPLDNWNVSNVTNMSAMFNSATSFNQPLNSWNVSNVTNMNGMFNGAHNFNQPLNNWDVSNAIDMGFMFQAAYSFNQSLNNWDVSNATNMGAMFSQANSFNQALNNWNVSNVVHMANMFSGADLFNQPLNNWDVSNVLSFSAMFQYALSFNQDLSNWQINSGEMGFFLNYSGLDKNNYDLFLSHLATLEINSGSLGAYGLNYCNQGAHDYLVNNLSWTISGDNLSSGCNIITGNILYDENNNACDPNDVAANGLIINASDGIHDFKTVSSNGTYNLGSSGTTFTVSVANAPAYYTVSPASATVTFTTSNVQHLDFCVTANQSIDDLNVTLLPISQARPGFEADYQLVVQNMGTQSVPNATVTLNFDNTKQSFVSAVPSPSSTTASQLTFDLTNLLPFETRTIDFTMQTFTPPTVNGGDLLSFTAAVTPNANDHTPADNTFVYDQTVVNSFDPNDKQVLQGEEIFISEADEYLNYLIRFQNTGTASAINVRILDTLHPKLDWNTIQPVSSSHNYRVEITDGNHVEFIFDNINLPHESADEPASHGFIAYKIKPKNDVVIGDIITGDARIYFDFNAPIITNTVSTEIVENLSAENFELASNIRLYPNPTNGILNISSETKLEKVELFSITGNRLLLQENSLEKIDLGQFPEGIYFLKIIGDNGAEVVEKIVKK